MCTQACAAHTSDEAAGGVLVDSGYVDNGAGLVGIPAETQEGMASGTQSGVLYCSSKPLAVSRENNIHMYAKLTYTYICTAIQVIPPSVRCGVVLSPNTAQNCWHTHAPQGAQ